MKRRVGLFAALVFAVVVMATTACPGTPEFCDRFPDDSSCLQ